PRESRTYGALLFHSETHRSPQALHDPGEVLYRRPCSLTPHHSIDATLRAVVYYARRCELPRGLIQRSQVDDTELTVVSGDSRPYVHSAAGTEQKVSGPLCEAITHQPSTAFLNLERSIGVRSR